MGTSHQVRTAAWVCLVCAGLSLSASGQDLKIDDRDPGFTVLSGSWHTSYSSSSYDTSARWLYTTAEGEPLSEVEWRPDLPQAGAYAVFVWYLNFGSTSTTAAPYTVDHVHGSTTVTIDQSSGGGGWVRLGFFTFESGDSAAVRLSNATAGRYISADAVRFIYTGEPIDLTMAVSPTDAGTTQPELGGPYTHQLNDLVVLKAQPAAGFAFDHWLVSNGSQPNDPNLALTTVTIDQSKTVTAVFRAAAQVELTIAVSPVEAGVTIPATGSSTWQANDVVALTATPVDGFLFDHWDVSNGSAASAPLLTSTTVTLDQSKTVTAVFVPRSGETSLRAFWADAYRDGFKSKAQIEAMVTQARQGHYNAIVAEVLASHDNVITGGGAYWDSTIVPPAQNILEDIDPLAYLVEFAHANGIEVHAWLLPFITTYRVPPTGSIPGNHPEWYMVPQADIGQGPIYFDGGYQLDPGVPGVQNYLASIVHELCNNYEIDGIHWDFIRYTDQDAGYPADSKYPQSSLARFQRITGRSDIPNPGDDEWSDFRRRTIDEVVRRMMVEVATADNPRQPLRHTAALLCTGDVPASFEVTAPYTHYQNWRFWMEQGYLDAGFPMLYFREDTPPHNLYFRNWVAAALAWRYNRHMVIGQGTYLNAIANSLAQLQDAVAAGVDGVCTYSYIETGMGILWYNYIANTLFTDRVDTPPMPWRDPNTAVDGSIYGRVTDGATGKPIDDAIVFIELAARWVRTDANGMFLITQLPANRTGKTYELAAATTGLPAIRPSVRVLPAGYTEANLALGDWLLGDVNVDGAVDAEDFARWLSSMTSPSRGPIPAGGDLFDFDLDGDVDLHDYQGFQVVAGS